MMRTNRRDTTTGAKSEQVEHRVVRTPAEAMRKAQRLAVLGAVLCSIGAVLAVVARVIAYMAKHP